MPKPEPEWQPSRLVHSSLKIKIVPPAGTAIWRLELKRRHLQLSALCGLTLAAGLAAGSFVYLNRATASLSELKSATVQQQAQLQSLDQQAGALDRQLRELRAQNRELRGLIGAPIKHQSEHSEQHALAAKPEQIAQVQSRLAALRAQASTTEADERRLHAFALRFLNMRHLEAMSRARVLAAIPSIRPVDYSAIASTFGWRTDPWPEFHKGLDLDADEGAPVRSAAAGTVAFAGWDGGFGQKIEIDHHNGIRTWYCHLSRIDVHAGESVTKGELIAAVGETGEATGPHLHYQVMKGGEAIDPMPFLSGVPASELASLK